ncbi:MAG: hypothetical protein GX844_02755 [Alcaligenaceae bacterium]|jgi:hypothetical protein|nr:hypothetical protein [Alcaligenaceae bacterium]
MKYKGTFIKFALLGVLASLAACGSPKPGTSVLSGTVNRCTIAPQSCIHEGRYESGERIYAEREAAALNRQQLERMRGGYGFFN